MSAKISNPAALKRRRKASYDSRPDLRDYTLLRLKAACAQHTDHPPMTAKRSKGVFSMPIHLARDLTK